MVYSRNSVKGAQISSPGSTPGSVFIRVYKATPRGRATTNNVCLGVLDKSK